MHNIEHESANASCDISMGAVQYVAAACHHFPVLRNWLHA
jgi:hypothetical protein